MGRTQVAGASEESLVAENKAKAAGEKETSVETTTALATTCRDLVEEIESERGVPVRLHDSQGGLVPLMNAVVDATAPGLARTQVVAGACLVAENKANAAGEKEHSVETSAAAPSATEVEAEMANKQAKPKGSQKNKNSKLACLARICC